MFRAFLAGSNSILTVLIVPTINLCVNGYRTHHTMSADGQDPVLHSSHRYGYRSVPPGRRISIRGVHAPCRPAHKRERPRKGAFAHDGRISSGAIYCLSRMSAIRSAARAFPARGRRCPTCSGRSAGQCGRWIRAGRSRPSAIYLSETIFFPPLLPMFYPAICINILLVSFSNLYFLHDQPIWLLIFSSHREPTPQMGIP